MNNLDDMRQDESQRSKDNHDMALRMAMKKTEEKTGLRCPTNLPYLTMSRIKQEKVLVDKRSKLWESIVLFLTFTIGVIAFVWVCGKSFFVKLYQSLSDIPEAMPSLPTVNVSMFVGFIFCFVFFVLLNSVLQHHFGKKG